MQTMVSRMEFPPTWRLLDLSYDSPFQNLALEETLVQADPGRALAPTIRVWVNHPAVVVGRFQDVKSEVDMGVCVREGIPIVRRFTGGGAVYHDDGNLNFTVSMPTPQNIELLGFQRAMSAIVQSWLSSLGLTGEYVQPNSIEVSGKKICGAATGFNREFILWHSSILISTNIEALTRALLPSRRHFETRHVRSNWKPVVTLEELLCEHLSMTEVKENLLRSFSKITDSKLQNLPLVSAELNQMHALLAEKYSKNEWNILGNQSASHRR